MKKFVIKGSSPNDEKGRLGYIGEEYRLYNTIANARIYNDVYEANLDIKKISNYWQNLSIAQVEVDVREIEEEVEYEIEY